MHIGIVAFSNAVIIFLCVGDRMFDKKVILVTGGTGSFGKEFIRAVQKRYSPKKIIVVPGRIVNVVI